MARQLNLIYALKVAEIVNIAGVESGKKCNCVCPACGEQLIAKKGKKQMRQKYCKFIHSRISNIIEAFRKHVRRKLCQIRSI